MPLPPKKQLSLGAKRHDAVSMFLKFIMLMSRRIIALRPNASSLYATLRRRASVDETIPVWQDIEADAHSSYRSGLSRSIVPWCPPDFPRRRANGRAPPKPCRSHLLARSAHRRELLQGCASQRDMHLPRQI